MARDARISFGRISSEDVTSPGPATASVSRSTSVSVDSAINTTRSSSSEIQAVMPAHGSTAARPTIKLGGRSPVKTRRRLQALPPDDASNPDTRVHRLNADDEIVAIRSKLKMSGLQTVYLVKIKGSSRPKKVLASELDTYPDLVADFNAGRASRGLAKDNDTDQSEGADGFSDNEGSEEEDEESGSIDSDEDEGANRRSRRGKRHLKKSRARSPKAPAEPSRRSSRQTRHQAAFVDEAEALESSDLRMDLDSQGSSSEGEQHIDQDGDTILVVNNRKAAKAKPKTTAVPKGRGKPAKKAANLKLKWGDADDIAEDKPSNLNNHRLECEKCACSPASLLMKAHKANANAKRKRKTYNDLYPDEESINECGAWVECGLCCVVYHFGCLPRDIQADIARTVKAEEAGKVESANHLRDSAIGSEPATPESIVNERLVLKTRRERDINQKIVIPSCAMCNKVKGTTCSICKHDTTASRSQQRSKEGSAVPTDASTPPPTKTEDVEMLTVESSSDIEVVIAKHTRPVNHVRNSSPDVQLLAPPSSSHAEPSADGKGPHQSLLFRCKKCKRAAHYSCLYTKTDGDFTKEDSALAWQEDWTCFDCVRWQTKLDVILAWRPIGTEAGDKVPDDFPRPTAKEFDADVEYLVKWVEHSYRYVEWVPHAFLFVTAQSKLSNFLKKGSDLVQRMQQGVDEEEEAAAILDVKAFGRAPNPNAEHDIPKDWVTIDKIINVEYVTPTGKRYWYNDMRPRPSSDPSKSIHQVMYALVKWQSLPHSEATRDEYDQDDPDWPSFEAAYAKFLSLVKVKVPKLNSNQIDAWEYALSKQKAQRIGDIQPDYIGGKRKLQLMDFQRLGVDWLYTQWKKRHPCVLSDEMGLGKTVQVISFLTHIHKVHAAQPFLIVVPNSTIANWLREFDTWAPADMKVVGYYGNAASRKVIEDNELLIGHGGSYALKAHVILCTYESLVLGLPHFRKMQYFETLVVDEAQRLKAGQSGKLFGALTSLTFSHRLLLTGTPLNNSVAEILNLMHFLDPEKFNDLTALNERYQNLNKDMVHEIQDLLKPYFLRRTKEEVLDLPSLTEVILPVSLRPIQRKLYNEVLAKNVESIEAIFRKNKNGKQTKRASCNNILMKLRQICQSAYLYSPEVEADDLSEKDSFFALVDSSSKLTLLSKLLPKLIARGHRMLIFSQFLGVLDILSRFLDSLDIPYTSLSGASMQSERQEAIDSFNAPNSALKVFLLTTRAGGVGINLTTADTVILFDQDFNPMQDMQAISRAHRIGQTKPVICYKLMNKKSCEEKILQSGRKKMALEHLIIQKMSQEEIEEQDVEDVLQFGAKEIYEAGEGELESDIKYPESKIDDILDHNEAEAAKPVVKHAKAVNKMFAYAKIWEGDNANVEDEAEEEDEDTRRNFWSNILQEQKMEQERVEREKARNMGRGRRERKYIMDLKPTYDLDASSDGGSAHKKQKRKKKTGDGSDDDFAANAANHSRSGSSGDESNAAVPIDVEDMRSNIEPSLLPPIVTPRRKKNQPNDGKRHFAKDSPIKSKEKRRSLLNPESAVVHMEDLPDLFRNDTQYIGLDPALIPPSRVPVPTQVEVVAGNDDDSPEGKRRKILAKLERRARKLNNPELLTRVNIVQNLRGKQQVEALLTLTNLVRNEYEKAGGI